MNFCFHVLKKSVFLVQISLQEHIYPLLSVSPLTSCLEYTTRASCQSDAPASLLVLHTPMSDHVTFWKRSLLMASHYASNRIQTLYPVL